VRFYSGLSTIQTGQSRGTPEQKKLYLPKLTSGEWTGTMCLTEPHCGTDLGLLRTKAEPQADGTYKLTGNKIFISAGEHDMAANIVHLVLARLPDAPAGSKGISLFVVPKFKVNADGSPGRAQPHLLRAWSTRWASTATPPAMIASTAPSAPWSASPTRAWRHVRDDERRPPGRGQPVAGPDRSGLPERLAYAKDRIQMRSPVRPEGRTSRPTRSSCTPTCARCC
jgi:hypothetical protein